MSATAWMQVAHDAAIAARDAGDFPNGALVVVADEVVGVSGSQSEGTPDPTAHAEVSAIRLAAAAGHDLTGATLVTTLEPCALCLHAAAVAGITQVFFGCTREEVGDDAYVSSLSAQTLAEAMLSPMALHHVGAPGIGQMVRDFLGQSRD